MSLSLARRTLITSAAAYAALTLLRIPVASAATSDDVEAALAEILNGRAPTEGGINLDVPVMAENGAQVPLTISLDSPMTEEDHVTAIHVVATQNPAPGIGSFHLTPKLARAEVFTRIRVAEEQEVLVLAEMSDGSVRQTAARIAVSIGGCAT